MTNGIYTVANDVVYDQLVALLNSIEVNVGTDIPVCVIPYDDRADKVRELVATRKNVEFFDNKEIIDRWEEFVYQIWDTYPEMLEKWKEQGINGIYRMGMYHRYCPFDEKSPFDKFIYFDADILVFDQVNYIFEQLDNNDVVVYDFQYKDPSHIYNINSPKLYEIFPEERINSEIFCAGLFASKRGLFPKEKRDEIVEQLKIDTPQIIYTGAPIQSILNYMYMRFDYSMYNFALNLPPEKRTGCSITSDHFEVKDNIVYDKGTRLTYLHYIGLSSKIFRRLCEGENLDFAYRDIFLHYRYLHERENYPKFQGKRQPYNQPPSLMKRVLKKLNLAN